MVDSGRRTIKSSLIGEHDFSALNRLREVVGRRLEDEQHTTVRAGQTHGAIIGATGRLGRLRRAAMSRVSDRISQQVTAENSEREKRSKELKSFGAPELHHALLTKLATCEVNLFALRVRHVSRYGRSSRAISTKSGSGSRSNRTASMLCDRSARLSTGDACRRSHGRRPTE